MVNRGFFVRRVQLSDSLSLRLPRGVVGGGGTVEFASCNDGRASWLNQGLDLLQRVLRPSTSDLQNGVLQPCPQSAGNLWSISERKKLVRRVKAKGQQKVTAPYLLSRYKGEEKTREQKKNHRPHWLVRRHDLGTVSSSNNSGKEETNSMGESRKRVWALSLLCGIPFRWRDKALLSKCGVAPREKKENKEGLLPSRSCLFE